MPGRARADGGADRDGDGIADADDHCADSAGLPPDGCPPVDTDGDLVIDRLDKCPADAGPPANQGCPDQDGDGDGLIDRLDKCPAQMGPRELGGCPAPDSDDDGVPDDADRCPDAKEVWNARQDGDGCPDKGAPLAVVAEGRIRLTRLPRLTTRGAIFASDRGLVVVAAHILRLTRAGAVRLIAVTDYGLSYGDSLQRAARLAGAAASAISTAAKLAPGLLEPSPRGPDGDPRILLEYR